ncbi:hypothetical protein Tco_0856568 [Tanacetum coccineum]|uniref:Uncharacterized protein n=1 Tax=Tanacetum coccineum TaxID=301880 RepID=A0ABQ5B7P6_9ASTR
MLCHSIISLPLFKSHNYHTSPSPSSSSLSSSPLSSMSCSNPPLNFSRKPRISVRQVWRRTTLTSKSPPSSQNSSPSLPLRVNPQSPSPPSYNPLRDQMINQLYNISSILESQTQNSSNAYSHAPPSPPSPLIRPPTNAQVEFHSIFCHCCRSARIPQVPDRYGYYVDIEEYKLGDLDEPPNYKAALAYPESDKWLEAMNTKMQSMKYNQVWYLVDLPSNGRTVGCK